MDARSQDARVEALWQKLDYRKRGYVDLVNLKKGLRKMDHRMLLRLKDLFHVPDGIAALKNADSLLKDVLDAMDENNDGRISYHG